MVVTDVSYSDPNVDVAALPESQPIHLIDKAREQFQGIAPPSFGVSKRDESWKFVVVPSLNGLRPKNPTLVKLKRRSWDKKTDFWTLDLNCRRYIVACFPSLYEYHAWINCDDFANEVIAFSHINHSALSPRDFLEFDTEDSDDSSLDDSSNDSVTPNTLRSGRTIRRDSIASKTADVEAPSTQEQGNLTHGGLVESVQRSLKTRPKNALKKGLRPSFSTLPTRSAVLKKEKVSTPSMLPSLLGPNTFPLGAPISSKTTTSERSQELTMMPQIASNPALAGLVSAQVDPSPPAPSARPQSSSGAVPGLSDYKRRHSKMAIHIEISGKPHERGCKSLRSCSSIETFLEVVCRKCNITDASVDTIMIRFPWLGNSRERQIIRLDRNVGFMGTLVDEVDNAPCWQEEGNPCCILMVKVLQKPGWDEDYHQTMPSFLSQR